MAMDKHIFNEEQLKRAEGIIRNPLAKLSSLSSSELRDLAVQRYCVFVTWAIPHGV